MRAALLILLLGLPLLTLADSLDELLASGELDIQTSITPAQGAVPGQHMRLTIEVATQRWFSGGTRIRLPEAPGLIILQTDQFAANASERRGATTWVIQRWGLDIFPQRAGSFTVPPVELQIQVNTAAGNVSGSTQTEAQSFEVVMPAALEEAESWVAAPRFNADQALDREATELAVGDALRQTVTFRGEDVQAMMLPTLEAAAPAGLKAYRSPPELENRNDRGTMRATRREEITYIAEQPGTYRLPPQEFYWWNTERGELELVSIPAVDISVAAGKAGGASKREALEIDWRSLVDTLVWVLAATLFAWLGWRLLPGARRAAAWLVAQLTILRQRYYDWRKPGLPASLNPGSNAGD